LAWRKAFRRVGSLAGRWGQPGRPTAALIDRLTKREDTKSWLKQMF
jgi:hypothetical protein